VVALEDAFDAALDALGPFERAPRLAVAVSGGADSLAAALLADRWCRARGGRATALIVDHGLRPESAAEAARTRALMGRRAIAAAVLALGATGGRRNLQAAARAGRYDALFRWCRDHGVLHLVTGHHRADQAETFLLRLARGSGVDGLSAMPAVQPAPHGRILRPLLGVDPGRLRDHLRAAGVDWVEDPSNRDARFQRVRVRRTLAGLADGAAIAARAAETAAELGRARAWLERRADRLTAGAVRLRPEGYAAVDAAALAAAPEEAGRRVLARLVRCVGGQEHAPRYARLNRLYALLRDGVLERGRTLGGCRIAPAGAGRVLVCREAARATVQPFDGGAVLWDGRFAIRATAPVSGGETMTIGPLGQHGWSDCLRAAPWLRDARLPHPARLALPALRRGGAVVAVPGLGFVAAAPQAPGPGPVTARFRPRRPLCAGAFVAAGPALAGLR
jgi:tRNA(Ile)-lysidine synthase